MLGLDLGLAFVWADGGSEEVGVPWFQVDHCHSIADSFSWLGRLQILALERSLRNSLGLHHSFEASERKARGLCDRRGTRILLALSLHVGIDFVSWDLGEGVLFPLGWDGTIGVEGTCGNGLFLSGPHLFELEDLVALDDVLLVEIVLLLQEPVVDLDEVGVLFHEEHLLPGLLDHRLLLEHIGSSRLLGLGDRLGLGEKHTELGNNLHVLQLLLFAGATLLSAFFDEGHEFGSGDVVGDLKELKVRINFEGKVAEKPIFEFLKI